MTKTKKLVLAGLFLAIGVILPQVTAHTAGENGGRMFLPTHIPVLIAGMVCGSLYGGAVGILAPVLSCAVTGGAMPAFYPMLPIMCAELFTYGAAGGLCSRKIKLNPYLSLIAAMVSGRVMYCVMWNILLKNAGFFAVFAAGLPGIIIQLAVIPPIVYAVKKYEQTEGAMNEKCPAAKTAKRLIISGEASCAAVKDGKVVYRDSGKGVKPLIYLYENERGIMDGAYFFDKIIGKAAAMILTLGGAKKVYALKMSESAENYLKKRGIKTAYGEKVGVILNIAGTGICPLENSVIDEDDPEKGYARIKETIAALSQLGKSGENLAVT